jgi:signal transduction histidine kinase
MILCLLLIAFGGVLFELRRAERDHIERIVEGVRDDGRQQLARWGDLTGVTLRQFVADHARWRETAAYIARPDPDWARQHLDDNLAVYGLDAIWLLRGDGTTAHLANKDPAVALPVLPAAAELAAAAQRAGTVDFFSESSRGLWQITGAPVLSPAGAGSWLFAARLWDDEQVARLGQISESRVKLLPPGAAGPDADAGKVSFTRPLNDWHGRPIRLLAMEQVLPHDLVGSIEWDGHVIQLFIAFGALLVVALALSVQVWVLRPLHSISQSLARNDPVPIAPLLRRHDEFRHVAKLIETSFAARRALEHEITDRVNAERALRTSEEQLRQSVEVRGRLARDLHDTVIQSIYSSGLGLEAVRVQLSKNPFGAEGRIQHCISSLNETIRLIRGYINDIEPDTHPERQSFSAAVRALARTMHTLSPVAIEVQIDESVTSQLTPALELHALQIVRECISNALRHGSASRITVSLGMVPGGAVLVVADNGCGFDPAQRAGTGRGLVNLGGRAAEIGATLQLDSTVGQGTRVSLKFPLPGKPLS